jgi:hypothetical protein
MVAGEDTPIDDLALNVSAAGIVLRRTDSVVLKIWNDRKEDRGCYLVTESHGDEWRFVSVGSFATLGKAIDTGLWIFQRLVKSQEPA